MKNHDNIENAFDDLISGAVPPHKAQQPSKSHTRVRMNEGGGLGGQDYPEIADVSEEYDATNIEAISRDMHDSPSKAITKGFDPVGTGPLPGTGRYGQPTSDRVVLDASGTGPIARPLGSTGTGPIARPLGSGTGPIAQPLDPHGTGPIARPLDPHGTGPIARPLDPHGTGPIARPLGSSDTAPLPRPASSSGTGTGALPPSARLAQPGEQPTSARIRQQPKRVVLTTGEGPGTKPLIIEPMDRSSPQASQARTRPLSMPPPRPASATPTVPVAPAQPAVRPRPATSTGKSMTEPMPMLDEQRQPQTSPHPPTQETNDSSASNALTARRHRSSPGQRYTDARDQAAPLGLRMLMAALGAVLAIAGWIALNFTRLEPLWVSHLMDASFAPAAAYGVLAGGLVALAVIVGLVLGGLDRSYGRLLLLGAGGAALIILLAHATLREQAIPPVNPQSPLRTAYAMAAVLVIPTDTATPALTPQAEDDQPADAEDLAVELAEDSALAQQISDLEAQLADAQVEITRLQTTETAQQQEIQQVATKLAVADGQIQQREQTIALLQDEAQVLRQEWTAADEARQALSEQLAALTAEGASVDVESEVEADPAPADDAEPADSANADQPDASVENPGDESATPSEVSKAETTADSINDAAADIAIP